MIKDHHCLYSLSHVTSLLSSSTWALYNRDRKRGDYMDLEGPVIKNVV